MPENNRELRNLSPQSRLMYQYEEDEFAGLERFRVFDPENQNSCTIIPAHGGHLQEVRLGGVSIIDGFQTVEELEKNYYSKSAILYPFPNRLKDGTYQHEGKTYQFPINNPATGNAIHGMGRTQEMTVHSIELGEKDADIHLRYEYPGDNSSYPFAFAFSLSYYFRENGGFDISMGLHNFSNGNIPVGLGWHPYFNLGGKVDALKMRLPRSKKVEIDEFMIPTGEKTPFDDFCNLRQIGDTSFDTCLAIEQQSPRAEVLLQSEQHQLRYWQETGEGKFNFLQVFIPPWRGCIALEPMTCNVDAFNNGDGLLILKSGQGVMGRCGFLLEKI